MASVRESSDRLAIYPESLVSTVQYILRDSFQHTRLKRDSVWVYVESENRKWKIEIWAVLLCLGVWQGYEGAVGASATTTVLWVPVREGYFNYLL